MQQKKNNVVTLIIIALLVGVVGFFGGIEFQKSQSVTSVKKQTMSVQEDSQGTTQGKQQGAPQGGMNAQGKKPISGEIVSIDKNTITVKMTDGSSKIVVYSSQLKVNKTTEGSVADLMAGTKITVMGSESTSGTVTADSISIGSGLIQQGAGGGQPPTQGGQPANNQ